VGLAVRLHCRQIDAPRPVGAGPGLDGLTRQFDRYLLGRVGLAPDRYRQLLLEDHVVAEYLRRPDRRLRRRRRQKADTQYERKPASHLDSLSFFGFRRARLKSVAREQ